MHRCLIAAWFLCGLSEAVACTCNWSQEITEERVLYLFCHADVVFVGDLESETNRRGDLVEYKFWPRIAYKGQPASPAYAISRIGGGCGYPFSAGARYVVFANRVKETEYVQASICGLTGMVQHREFVLQVLNKVLEQDRDACSDAAKSARAHVESDRRVDEFRELVDESRDVQGEP